MSVSYSMLADGFYHQGRVHEGLALVRKGLDLASELGELRWSNHALTTLTSILITLGDYAGAEMLVTRRVSISETLENRHSACLARLDEALLARIAGQFESALESYALGLRAAERSGVPNLEPLILLKMAAMHRLLGQWTDAEPLLEQSTHRASELGLDGSAFLAERGRFAYARRADQIAVNFLLQAAANPTALPYDHFDTIAIDLGRALLRSTGEGARQCFLQSLELDMTEQQMARALYALVGLAECALREGKGAEARALASMVEQHPVLWHEHRIWAQNVIEKIDSSLPPGSEEITQVEIHQGDLWDLVKRRLAHREPNA